MTTQGKRYAKYTERITAPIEPALKAEFVALSDSLGISASDRLRALIEHDVKRNRKRNG